MSKQNLDSLKQSQLLNTRKRLPYCQPQPLGQDNIQD